MLKYFYVKNFKSWKSGTLISMKAESISEHPFNYARVKSGKEKLLKNLVIFGSNASGKSNLLDSITFMYNKVMEKYNEREWNKTIPIELKNNGLFSALSFRKPVCQTFANKETKSTFEVTFVENNDEYSYGFEIRDNLIVNEWFDKNDKSIFDRKNTSNPNMKEYKFLTDKVLDDELYLSYIIPFIKIQPGDPLKHLTKFFISMGIFKDFEKLDTNILNIILIDTYKRNIKMFEKINGFFKIIDFGILRMEYDEPKKAIYFIHRGKKDTFRVYLGYESLGTRKMLITLIGILQRLETGGVIVADELTSSLHPLLTKIILDSISNPEMNTGNAQIIFSTHDIFFMRKEQFRRDEIGYVQKDMYGESHFHKLYDIKDEDSTRVRNDATYWKNYIKGSYEGTPNIDYDMYLNEESVFYGKKQT